MMNFTGTTYGWKVIEGFGGFGKISCSHISAQQWPMEFQFHLEFLTTDESYLARWEL